MTLLAVLALYVSFLLKIAMSTHTDKFSSSMSKSCKLKLLQVLLMTFMVPLLWTEQFLATPWTRMATVPL